MLCTIASMGDEPTGLGDIKVQRLFETFHEPFLRKTKAAAPRQTDQYQPTGGASTGASLSRMLTPSTAFT